MRATNFGLRRSQTHLAFLGGLLLFSACGPSQMPGTPPPISVPSVAPPISQTPVRPRAEPAPPTLVGVEVQGLNLPMGRCSFLSYASSDSLLVAADDLLHEGQYVEIWDRATGKLHSRLQASEADIVSHLALARDGRTLASGYVAGGIDIWDLHTGQKLRELRDHKGPIFALDFTADGAYLASGGGNVYYKNPEAEDFAVRLWNTRSGALLHVIEAPLGPVECLSFFGSDAELMLAVTSYMRPERGARFQTLEWSAADPEQPKVLPQVWRLLLSPDGSRALRVEPDALQLVDTASTSVLATYDRRSFWLGTATHEQTQRAVLTFVGELLVIDIDTGAVLCRIPQTRLGPGAVALSSDGLEVAASAGGGIRCFRLEPAP